MLQHYLKQSSVVGTPTYRTGMFGKYLNKWVSQGSTTPPNFDIWGVFDNGVYYPSTTPPTSCTGAQQGVDCVIESGNPTPHQLPPNKYATKWVAEQAASFIYDTDFNQPGTPWFLYVAPTAPHGVQCPAAPCGSWQEYPTNSVETTYQSYTVPPFTPKGKEAGDLGAWSG